VESKNKEKNDQHSAVGELIRLIETLRGKDGCPWDRKQTPTSMSVYLMEEMYELIDAIESGRPEDVCEELGDVWFHIFFMARMYEELGHFDAEEIARRITEKMIRRHPHVFGDGSVDSADDVKQKWHAIKKEEKRNPSGNSFESVLDSVPKKTPALLRAYSLSDRVSKEGFDWDDVWGALKKVEEELSELKSAISNENRQDTALEFGDVMFTLVTVARFLRIHPETALSESTRKFEKRFRQLEQTISEANQSLESMSQDEKEHLWQSVKRSE